MKILLLKIFVFTIITLSISVSAIGNSIIANITFNSKDEKNKSLLELADIKFSGRAGFLNKESFAERDGTISWSFKKLKSGKYILRLETGAGIDRQMELKMQTGAKWIRLGDIVSDKAYEYKATDFPFEIKSNTAKQSFRLQAKGKGLSYLHKAILISKPGVVVDLKANNDIIKSDTTASITSVNGLKLSFNQQGNIKSVIDKNQNITENQTLTLSGLNISTMDLPIKDIQLKNSVIQLGKNSILQKFNSDKEQLNGELLFSNHNQYIKVSGKIFSSAKKDRGVRVKFSLPIRAAAWHWSGKIGQVKKIKKSGGRYTSSYKFDSQAFLTDGKQTSLKSENVSELYKQTYSFCTAIYGEKEGLSIAIPRDQYQMVDMCYDSNSKTYDIVFSLGLSPQAKTPNQATFIFYLTRINPQWGYRSALETYYNVFPQFFTKRVKVEGSMFPFISAETVKNSDEFGHYLNWSGSGQKSLSILGVYNFSYSVPGQLFVNLNNYDPRSGVKVPLPTILDALKRSYPGQGTIESLCYNEKDKPIIGNTTYADFIATVNNDPSLPYGKYYKKYIMSQVADSNGVAYDGLLGGLNYRKSHFNKTRFSLMYNPIAKKCMINNFYSCLELAKEVYKEFGKKNKYIVANAVPQNFLFGAPIQDVITEECGINVSYSDLAHYRQTMYRKTVCLITKNYWINTTNKMIEHFIKRCLAFGVFPGVFDATPSSNHPYSSYWMHPQWYNRDRAVWRKYNQLIREIAQAGWNPIPYAEFISSSQVLCERFGDIEQGTLFYTIRTKYESGIKTLKINKKEQSISGKLIIFDEFNNRFINYSEDTDFIKLKLALKSNDVQLISINTPESFKQRKVNNALAWLQSREKSREVGKLFGNKLTKWAAKRLWESKAYLITDKVAHNGQQSITNSEKLDISQALYMLQKKPHDLVLGVWSKTKNAGVAKVNITVHDLNGNCFYDKKYTLNISEGTHDWEFKELKIPAKTPIESVKISLEYKGEGKVWLDDISLRSRIDDYKQNLLADGGFEEKFLSLDQSGKLDAEMLKLKQLLIELQGHLSDNRKCQAEVKQIYQQINNISSWIEKSNIQNQAARELRDLNDIKRLLNPIFPNNDPITLQFIAPDFVSPGKEFDLLVNLKNNQRKIVKLDKAELILNNSAKWLQKTMSSDSIAIPSGENVLIKYRITVPQGALGKESQFNFTFKNLNYVIKTTHNITVEPFEISNIKFSKNDAKLEFMLTLANKLSKAVQGRLKFEGKQSNEPTLTDSKECFLKPGDVKKFIFIIPSEKLQRGRHSFIITFKSPDGSVHVEKSFAYKNIAHCSNGAIIKVDGAMERYTVKPINDGITETANSKWYESAWAVNGESAHWIEVKLPQPEKIRQVVIFWQRENNSIFPAQKFEVQIWRNNKWITQFATTSNTDEISNLKFKPVTTNRIRIYQPKKGGPIGRENIMWVRELEIY